MHCYMKAQFLSFLLGMERVYRILFEGMKVHVYSDKGAHVTYSGERVCEAVVRTEMSAEMLPSLAAKTSAKYSL